MPTLIGYRAAIVALIGSLLLGCSGDSSNQDAPEQSQSPVPSPGIRILDVTGEESSGALEFAVELSRVSDQVVEVTYATVDGLALAGSDYEQADGVLAIPAGMRTSDITIALLDDAIPEETESLSVELTNPMNATIERSSAIGTIEDSDELIGESTFNPDWGSVGVFTEANTCGQCHRASTDGDPAVSAVMRDPRADSGSDISPSTQWGHSMMAHAFPDPYYHAKLADELELFPDIAATIEDKCLTCHAPMGRTHAHQTGIGLETGGDCAVPDGCYRLNAALDTMHAKAGVSCTVCHQIKADGLGTEDGISGGFVIADELDPDAFTVFGPYLNPHPGGSNVMLDRSGYAAQFGAQLQGSEFCAVCHTLYTGSLNVNDGTPTGRKFLEQGPYLEWQLSEFGPGGSSPESCQDCHQPQPEGDADTTRIAVRPNGTVNEMWPERNPFHVHELVGGNTHVLEMYSAYSDLLGLERSTTASGFQEKVEQTRAFLSGRSAELSIDRFELAGQTLHVSVLVTNRTGHKLPTAYPSRRVWVNLVVRDNAGGVLFDSGSPDANGRLGIDERMLTPACLESSKPVGFDSTPCYEPHRDLITRDDEVAVYEAVMADSNADITHVLLHADGLLKDNRLPPAGFTVTEAAALEPQIVPVGVGGDTDFNNDGSGEGSGSDLVAYQVDTGGRAGPFSVEARLLYQSIKPSFVESMRSSAPRVVRFKVMYDSIPPPAEELARVSASL